MSEESTSIEAQSIPFELSQYGTKSVCLVISAKNEERSVGAAIRGGRPYAHDVVVMDGHSTDRTSEVARQEGARVYPDPDPGRGKGAAIRASLELVKADVVVLMDADGSHDPGDIPRLALPVIRNECDLCIGSRFAGGSDELSATLGQLIRTIGNIATNVAINRRWGVELTDTHNGFRAVRRQALVSVGLRQDRHPIEPEMVMKMLRHGYRVMNVPAHEYSREYGESHIKVWKEWPRYVWCMMTNLLYKNPPKGFNRVVSACSVPNPQPEGQD